MTARRKSPRRKKKPARRKKKATRRKKKTTRRKKKPARRKKKPARRKKKTARRRKPARRKKVARKKKPARRKKKAARRKKKTARRRKPTRRKKVARKKKPTRRKKTTRGKPVRRKPPRRKPAPRRSLVAQDGKSVDTGRTSVAAAVPEQVGRVTHWFGRVSAGIVAVEQGELRIGDTVHFRGHTTDFYQRIERMEFDHRQIDRAGPGQEVGLQLSQRVREGDQVFRVAR